MARPSIELSPGEIHDFVGSRNVAILATMSSGGAPSAALVTGASLAANDQLTLRVPADSTILADIEHDDRVSCAFECAPEYNQIQAVIFSGRATVQARDEDVVTLSIAVGGTTSFDFSKIPTAQ